VVVAVVFFRFILSVAAARSSPFTGSFIWNFLLKIKVIVIKKFFLFLNRAEALYCQIELIG